MSELKLQGKIKVIGEEQKFDSGFVRISTNVKKADSSYALGTFIPNSSLVSRKLNQATDGKSSKP